MNKLEQCDKNPKIEILLDNKSTSDSESNCESDGAIISTMVGVEDSETI